MEKKRKISMNKIIESWRGGLIVSCQAPANSPLDRPEIIAAFVETAEQNGAVGVRIDAPRNIVAVKNQVNIPVLGIYKIISDSSEVYITPNFSSVAQIGESGADIIALDATARERANGEKLENLVDKHSPRFESAADGCRGVV